MFLDHYEVPFVERTVRKHVYPSELGRVNFIQEHTDKIYTETKFILELAIPWQTYLESSKIRCILKNIL